MSELAENYSARDRVGAFMGIVFTVGFAIWIAVTPNPKNPKNTAEFAREWTTSGHRMAAVIAAYCMVLGVLAFVWFAWSLHKRINAWGSGLMFSYARIFASIAFISVMIQAAIPGGKQFGGIPVPEGALAQQFSNVGVGLMLVAGSLSAGMFIGFASYLARKTKTLPGWLTIAGFVVAVLQLAGAMFLPLLLVPLWVFVVAITLLLRRDPANVAASPTP